MPSCDYCGAPHETIAEQARCCSDLDLTAGERPLPEVSSDDDEQRGPIYRNYDDLRTDGGSEDSGSYREEVPEPPRFVSDHPTLVTHCTGCEEKVGLERHIMPIGDKSYAVCYDCAPLESGEEPQQKKLVSDGGTAVEGRTRVGHCKQDETDVYAGRGPDGRNMLGSRVGQRGWLGNPHRVEENGRELSIEKFRIDFEQKLARDPTFAAAVADLSGKTLGCWCQRLDEDEPACHAEIIAEHADRLARELHTDREQGDLLSDGGAEVAEPHAEPLRVTERDGLCLPPEYIGHEGGLVVRMPNGGTIDFKPREWGAHLGNVRPSHFGEVNQDGPNDHLEADQVGLKKYGEDADVYGVGPLRSDPGLRVWAYLPVLDLRSWDSFCNPMGESRRSPGWSGITAPIP